MTRTPTAEQFLAETATEEDELDQEIPDPLASIAESLRTVAAILASRGPEDVADTETEQHDESFELAYAALKDKNRALFDLLAEVE